MERNTKDQSDCWQVAGPIGLSLLFELQPMKTKSLLQIGIVDSDGLHEQELIDGCRAGTWKAGLPHLSPDTRSLFQNKIGTVGWHTIFGAAGLRWTKLLAGGNNSCLSQALTDVPQDGSPSRLSRRLSVPQSRLSISNHG
jgi:hypothetical protein